MFLTKISKSNEHSYNRVLIPSNRGSVSDNLAIRTEKFMVPVLIPSNRGSVSDGFVKVKIIVEPEVLIPSNRGSVSDLNKKNSDSFVADCLNPL